MQLVRPNCRQLNGKRLSSKVRILACTNRREDPAAGGLGFIEPLKQRFVSFPLETDLNEWSSWALGNGLDPHIAAYLSSRPAHLLVEQPSPDLHRISEPAQLGMVLANPPRCASAWTCLRDLNRRPRSAGRQ